MCVMFGYTKEELMERNIKIIMTHPHSEMHDTYLKRYFRTHKKRIIGTTRTLKARHRVHNCTDSLSRCRAPCLVRSTQLLDSLTSHMDVRLAGWLDVLDQPRGQRV